MKNRHTYKDVTLTQLRSFSAVYHNGGYAAAARELALSGPAVWEQVQGLERSYGIKLFERQGSRVVPTAAGEKAIEMIRPLLDGIDSTQSVLREEEGISPEEIRLVSGVRMMQEEVSQGLIQFQKKYPNIRISLFHPKEESLDEVIKSGQADLGLIADPGPLDLSRTSIKHELAYELDYLLVTPPQHPLNKKKRLKLSDLTEYGLIIARPSAYSRQQIDAKFHEIGLLDDLKISVETSTASVSLSCVRAGLGPAIMAGNPNGHLCKGLSVRSVNHWFGPGKFFFVYKKGAYRPQSHLFLMDSIRQSAQKHSLTTD